VEVNSDGFLLFFLSVIRILLPFCLPFDQIAGVVVSQKFLDYDLVHSWTASCRFSEELLQYLQGKISISREGTIVELPVPSACVDHLATWCFVSPHLIIYLIDYFFYEFPKLWKCDETNNTKLHKVGNEVMMPMCWMWCRWMWNNWQTAYLYIWWHVWCEVVQSHSYGTGYVQCGCYTSSALWHHTTLSWSRCVLAISNAQTMVEETQGASYFGSSINEWSVAWQIVSGLLSGADRVSSWWVNQVFM
jgi:hypothetical protein